MLSLNAQDIPLPEHPRPDFQRDHWRNLNGTWAYAFDPLDVGISEDWMGGTTDFSKSIQVPFTAGNLGATP